MIKHLCCSSLLLISSVSLAGSGFKGNVFGSAFCKNYGCVLVDKREISFPFPAGQQTAYMYWLKELPSVYKENEIRSGMAANEKLSQNFSHLDVYRDSQSGDIKTVSLALVIDDFGVDEFGLTSIPPKMLSQFLSKSDLAKAGFASHVSLVRKCNVSLNNLTPIRDIVSKNGLLITCGYLGNYAVFSISWK